MKRAIVSSQHRDIISKSRLIHSGCPALYQLKPRKEELDLVTKITLGQKNFSKLNKTVLLVGETGAGKSTLINALVNYAMGVKFEDEVWFQIVEDEKRSQSESQTSDVVVYEIFGFEGKTLPFSLTIIDTPGYGDTRGIEKDTIVSHKLFDLFRSDDGVHEISAVGLVIKATDNRVNDRLAYVLNSVMSLFGKNLENNIVALFTNSDGREPKNALGALRKTNIKCARNEKNQLVYFLFDNCQSEDRTEEGEFLKVADKITEKGVRAFAAFLEKTGPKRLMTTAEVLNERISLMASIQNLQERIKVTEQKQEEIRHIQEALKKHEEEMNKNKDFTVEVVNVYKAKELNKCKTVLRQNYFEKAMCCTICEENCHYPGCTLVLSPQHCEVIKKGRCTVCTQKCPASAHVRENWRYVPKIRRVKYTMTHLEEKYMKDQAEGQKMAGLLKNLQKEMRKLSREKSQLVDEAYQHVVRLEQIALKADSVSTNIYLDFLIEKMKENRDPEKVQKLEQIKAREDEGTRLALQYMIKNSPLKKSMPNSVPAVYQLSTKRDRTGPLTRVTVGVKDESKPNKNILLVGETGAGKSTLLNALVNHTMGVKWEDGVWFEIVEEEEEAQTSGVIVYQIFEGKTLPYSLTIIDTPGYGNTRGIRNDARVNKSLSYVFQSEDGVHELHAVGLVMKASDNRMSDRLMYVFDSVMSLFGKNLEKNIVALITHSNGRTPKNALQALEAGNVKCATNEENKPVYFLFNNQQHEDRQEQAEYLERAHKISQVGVRAFIEFLEKSEAQKVLKTAEVLQKHVVLTACIQNLQDRIKAVEQKQTEIQQIRQGVKEHEEELQRNERCTIYVDETCKIRKPVSASRKWMLFYEGAVTCSICEENCHYPGCTMALSPTFCQVMKGGHCTVCSRKCPASAHVKKDWIYEQRTRRVEKTLTDVKQKYESKTSKDQDLLKTLKREHRALSETKSQLIEEAFQHVVELEQIALKADSVSTNVHLDFLIEKMRENGDRNKEKVQHLEEFRRKVDEGTRAALRYKHVSDKASDASVSLHSSASFV